MTASLLVRSGVARWFKKDLKGPLANYGKAIEIDPNNASAYFRRALALQSTQPERAIANL
jgi:Tfp pilus assembly protein PilF